MSVPTLLALAGTALMAVAIFVPIRSAIGDRKLTKVADRADRPHWPELVEPSAAYCDAAARVDLVDALASIGSPWAENVLRQASGEETDPLVLAAIESALSASSVKLSVGEIRSL